MTSSGPAVRDAVFDVLRERGLTTVFANPGSTEVTFLGGLPDDFRFVLALHEGALVGMASGYAIGSGEPAFVLVHTTAGLGNAVSALATARVNRAPLVVLIGQQDRRHLAQEPFLAGRLDGLAGEYPVWVDQPARPQDVPGALARAWHEARTARGPALVIVPMDDWLAPAGEAHEIAAPARLVPARAAEPAAIAELADLIGQAGAPVLVVGAGADDPDTWAALVELAERLPPETVLVEEAPSSRPELMARLPARQPLGFLSAAMGGLGFGLSAPIGVRMAQPSRPVVAVVGDGSAMYAIQALWSAARYEVGAIFVVLANGGYRVMDRLAEAQDEAAPWPAFGAIDITAIAQAQGCPARRVETFAELEAALDEALDGIGERREPLLLEVVVTPDREFVV
jgi:thiamine pyrophosphate-dependent acetolactate synthase large subunit-like protein